MTAPDLTVIVNFHNMGREAPRTLFTLMPGYQLDVTGLNYEIVAIDHGSTEPLDPSMVEGVCGDRGRLTSIETDSQSPATAINAAVRQCSSEWIICLIDGARMVSPGVLRLAMLATQAFPRPFVYTLSMHLGHKVQNDAMLDGYNQAVEDALLSTTDWRSNGYALFGCSCTSMSSRLGFFSKLTETNLFLMRSEDYLRLGGLSEDFQSPGGGLVNLDFFNRVHECADINPVMLLGEATFHQFHGGVATNVPRRSHPFPKFAEEYRRIRGRAYQQFWRPPVYLGELRDECRSLIRDSGDSPRPWRSRIRKLLVKS